MKKDIIPLITTIVRMRNKIFGERFPIICWIATEAPVLVFDIR